MKIFFLLILFSFAWPCQAEIMNSSSFTMEAAGFSSGGAPSAAASFTMTATLGQSSPLRISAYPKSSSFRNFPGLRYQLEDYHTLGINHGFLPSIYLLLLLDGE